MRLKKLFLIFYFFILAFNLKAHQNTFVSKIDSLNSLFLRISKSNSNQKKDIINDSLITCFKELLLDENSFELSFDSIKYLTVLKADDNLLNVFTWNLNYSDGTYKYFGFLQYKSKEGLKVFFLNDSKFTHGIDTNDKRFRNASDWFGAIYYELIPKKWNGRTYYTLIGWDGVDLFTNRKVIEVLYFEKDILPIFGKKMFKIDKASLARLIFEYTESAVMMLRFNKKHDIIVLDHLSPSESRFQGMPEYYGPDKSYDALRFKMGKWVLESNIDPNIAINFKKNQNVNLHKRRKSTNNRLK